VAGIVLSHPQIATTASNACARTKSSIESAITSRETSDPFMPSVPIVIPSDTTIVLHSIGVPPAARIPSFTFSASDRRWKLQGVTSLQVFATATSGRARSASVRPVAFNIARAGARATPFFIASLRMSQTFRGPKIKSPATCLQVRGAFAWTFLRRAAPTE
jgi:hypothetical protein